MNGTMERGISRPIGSHLLEALRRYRVTVIVTALTLAVSIPALLSADLVSALQQDPRLIRAGQWWRMITPMVIQGFGIGQFAFNLAGIVLVGMVVERRFGAVRWLILYGVSGIVSIAATCWLFPDRVDSGSSAAVAGLIGGLVIAMLIDRELPPWPSLLYGIFFAVYLSGLAVAGPMVGAVAGTVCIPAFALARRFAPGRVRRLGAAAVIIAATVVLLVAVDVHGIGLATGMIIATVVVRLPPRVTRAAGVR